ncbi:hypothetical protein F4604DRAFT_1918847 [Suillus subluteus]|nr:hypothetical protein F4604DRAFT_1918847 [Suillus subluteus]
MSHPLPALKMSNKKPKDWWWGYFDTHPDFEKKLSAAYANEKERRSKVMCGARKISKVIDEQQKDREEQRQGLRNDRGHNLFSLFSTVLKKLQSHLGLKGLTDLAESCLHLRDEYMQIGDKKGHLRRAMKIIPDPLHPPPPVTSETSTYSLQPDDLSVSEQPDTHNEDEDDHSLVSITSVAPLAMRTLQVQCLYSMMSSFNNFLTSRMRVGLNWWKDLG